MISQNKGLLNLDSTSSIVLKDMMESVLLEMENQIISIQNSIKTQETAEEVNYEECESKKSHVLIFKQFNPNVSPLQKQRNLLTKKVCLCCFFCLFVCLFTPPEKKNKKKKNER